MLNSMPIKKSLLVVTVFLLLGFFVHGCNNPDKTEVVNTPTLTITPTKTFTPTATMTPTITPIATLNPSEAESEIYRLMRTNDNCYGYCFWGITSSSTAFNEAINRLRTLKETTLTKNNDGSLHYNDYFRFSEERIGIGMDFSDKNGIVEDLYVSINSIGRLDVPGSDWTAFRVDNYLKANGMPEDFFIDVGNGPEGRFGYALILKYDNWYVYYHGNQEAIRPNSINACPLIEHNIQRIDLISREQSQEYIDLNWLLEQYKLTGRTKEEFFQLLTGDVEKACFDVNFEKYYEVLGK